MNEVEKLIKEIQEGNSFSHNFVDADIVEESFDFTGNTSIADKQNSEKEFGFTITNACTASKNVAILTGNYETKRAATPAATTFDTTMIGGGTVVNPANNTEVVLINDNPATLVAAGISVDAVLGDGFGASNTIYHDGTNGITVTYEAAQSPEMFMKWLRSGNVAHVYKIHITSTVPAYLEKKMILKDVSPWEEKRAININFSGSNLPVNANDSKIIVDRDFVLNGNSVLYTSVPANSTISITLHASLVASEANRVKAVVGRVKRGLKVPAVTARTISTLSAADKR